jgi:hypothetical protein
VSYDPNNNNDDGWVDVGSQDYYGSGGDAGGGNAGYNAAPPDVPYSQPSFSPQQYQSASDWEEVGSQDYYNSAPPSYDYSGPYAPNYYDAYSSAPPPPPPSDYGWNYSGPYAPQYYDQYSNVGPYAPGYQDYQPQQQQQQQQQPDYWGMAQGVLGQTVSHLDQQQAQAPTDFWGQFANAVTSPWQAPAKEGQAPWEAGWDFANRAAGSFMGGFGEAVKPVGGWVDTAAESNIPFLDPAAEALRFGYEQTAEPLMQTVPGLIGTLAAGVDTNASLNPFDWRFDRQAAAQGWEENDPMKVFDRTYQAQIAQGKSDQEARLRAQREAEKVVNPLNRALKRGEEEFSTLSPLVQLGVGLADPIGNKVGDFVFRPGIKGAQNVARLGAEVSGAGRLAGKVGKALESPQQVYSRIERELGDLGPEVQNIATQTSQTPFEVLDDLVNNPESPYAQQVPMQPKTADAIRDILDLSRERFEGTRQDPALAGGRVTSEAENALAGQAQAATPEQAAEMGKLAAGRYDDLNMLEGQPKATKGEMNPALEAEFNEFFPESTKQTATQRPTRPDYYQAIKTPGLAGETGDFLRATQQALGLQAKALKLDGTIGHPRIVPTKALEQFGVTGKAVRALGLPISFMSRAFLNTPSRAIRDSLGNYAKLAVEGYSTRGRAKTNATYAKLFGESSPDVAGGGVSKDTLGGGGGKSNRWADLAYFAISPFNEGTAWALRKASGGRFKDWNTFTEGREAAVKTLIYKQERIKRFNQAVDQAVGRGDLTQAQAQLFKTGDVKAETLANFIKGSMPQGADLGAVMRGEYHPLNFSPEVMQFVERSLGGRGGAYGSVLQTALDSLEGRLAEYNRQQRAAYPSAQKPSRSKNPKAKALADYSVEANTKPYTPADITPDHPVWKSLEADIKKGWDELYNSNVVAEQADPRVQNAIKMVVGDALQWAARSKNLANFKRVLQRGIDQNEGAYKANIKGDIVDQLAARKKGGQAPAPSEEAGQGGIFEGVTDHKDLLQTLRQMEGFKSDVANQIGGEALSVTHQKALAQALIGDDRAAFEQLKEQIGSDRRYQEGVKGSGKGKGGYTDYTRANNDRVLSRLDVYWNEWHGIKAEAPAGGGPDPARLQTYYSYIYGMDAPSNVLSPATLQKMGQKFGPRLTPAQRQHYFDDFMGADAHIRQVTGNAFKLDPDTFHPARIEDGASLQELLGMERPAVVGQPLPRWAEIKPGALEETLQGVSRALGPDATKLFRLMEPGERDMAFSEIAKAMGFPDPFSPRTAQARFDLENHQAEAHLEALKQDMMERKNAARQQAGQARAQAQQNEVQTRQVTNQLLALRSKFAIEASQGAFQRVSDIYFDYANKNVVDQVLGNLVPFNFWGRQNFVYAMKHFAEHPMHLAAILNFYQQLEQQNANQGIPEYARGNLFLWKNPDGSKVLWNFNSLMPLNPLGDSDSLMQVVGPDDPAGQKVANTNPLAVLFGSDRKSGGKVTGRDKGLLATFFRPNPIIDIASKTGKPNEIMKALGWVSDGFGSPDPSGGRGQKMTLGLLPGRAFYQEAGAATGLTKALRQQGVLPADLDIEAPLNEALFGKGAGKPEAKIMQELAGMAQRGEISPDKAKLAIAAYKEGNWTPEALKALDAIQGENAGRRILNNIGFSSVVTDTPRQQLSGKLSQGYQAVKGDKEKTKEYFAANPGASVKFSASDSPAKIRQGLADDQTRAAKAELDKQRKAGKLTSRQYSAEIDKLQGANADYFGRYPVDQAKQTYYEQLDDYKNIGGARYDALSELVTEYMNAGDKKTAGTILSSTHYKQAKAARDQFLEDHPEFAQRYQAENEAKYGPKPAASPANKPNATTTYTTAKPKTSYSAPKKSYAQAPARGSYAPAPPKSANKYTGKPGQAPSSPGGFTGGPARPPMTNQLYQPPGGGDTGFNRLYAPPPTRTNIRAPLDIAEAGGYTGYVNKNKIVRLQDLPRPVITGAAAKLPATGIGGSKPKGNRKKKTYTPRKRKSYYSSYVR